MLKVQRATSEGLKDVLIGTYRIYLNSGVFNEWTNVNGFLAERCLLHQITLLCTPNGLRLNVWNIVQIKKLIELTNSRKTIYGIFNSNYYSVFSVFTDTRTWFSILVHTLDASIQNVRENKNGGLQNCSIDKLHILLLNSLSVVASQIHYIYGDHPQFAMS